MPSAPALGPVIREIREARYTHGILCPHCACVRCLRWGGFSGRQRYRCTGCRRTFSDLTGTPASYLKRLVEFARYRSCVRASVSVRRAARLVGVHKDTAFRWRHRVLDDVRTTANPQLRGYTEIADARFPHVEKGRRRRSSSPRVDWRWRPLLRPVVWVTFVRDRLGFTYAAITGDGRPGVSRLAQALATHFGDDASLLTGDGHMSAHVALANRIAVRACSRARRYDEPALLLHTDNVRDHIRAFRAWLERFRGVSTCYLENYLAWFAMLSAAEGAHTCAGLLHWPLPPPTRHVNDAEDTLPPSTLPADKGGGS